MNDDTDSGEQPSVPRRLGLLEVVGSALAAAFGVQSSKNRARDFTHGKPSHFILIGIVFTVLFVLAVAGVVSLVLSRVG